MNELLLKAEQTADLLESDVREAHENAGPLLELVLRDVLADVVQIRARLVQIQNAVEASK